MADSIDRGRDAFDRRAWGYAYEELSAAAKREPLQVDDLERLACAAYLIGRAGESQEVWMRAHQECARIGEVARAARCGFWLAFGLLNSGQLARGAGWVERAQRLLDERRLKCVEQGYLRYAAALHTVFSGDVETALVGFRQSTRIGQRFRDPELITLSRIGEGRCLIFVGRLKEGVALLDEAMVAVTAQEISPIAVGDSYCTVIAGCQDLFDVRRAQEWTAALSGWCNTQPELVIYRGQCLIHRAELMRLHGAWAAALDEISRACGRLADPPDQPALGTAWYVRGDLHRVCGELAEAEDAYRAANELGRQPQPGLALLRLAQGEVASANAAIRRLNHEVQDPISRVGVLAPFAEIVLAAGDPEAASGAADELKALAAQFNQPYLQALSAHVEGTVLLARNDPGALAVLRGAWRHWCGIDAPYEAARVRVLIAQACRAMGDEDGAEMELDAARTAFTELSASLDLAHVQALSHMDEPRHDHGLTPRELEVLVLVAKGKTNRQIADDLFISEKTVASHLNHIFAKLGVPSRAAATAYAYENELT
ncbi:MAG: LuxR C-terminal-related transcriptional regulator [Micromonosporaceae bacterium]